jgi:hypothetical protein
MSGTDGAISPENKRIARYVADAFGGDCRVDEYANDSENLFVGVLRCADQPQTGVTSYSTIKLSDHPMTDGVQEFPTRLELAGVCMSTATWFPNVLASAAFTIMQSEGVYRPGTVLQDLVHRYHPSELRHLYLTAPFLWERKLTTLDCGTKKVSWLLAVPISETERVYLLAHGDNAFERLLERERADFANPDRTPVV